MWSIRGSVHEFLTLIFCGGQARDAHTRARQHLNVEGGYRHIRSGTTTNRVPPRPLTFSVLILITVVYMADRPATLSDAAAVAAAAASSRWLYAVPNDLRELCRLCAGVREVERTQCQRRISLVRLQQSSKVPCVAAVRMAPRVLGNKCVLASSPVPPRGTARGWSFAAIIAVLSDGQRVDGGDPAPRHGGGVGCSSVLRGVRIWGLAREATAVRTWKSFDSRISTQLFARVASPHPPVPSIPAIRLALRERRIHTSDWWQSIAWTSHGSHVQQHPAVRPGDGVLGATLSATRHHASSPARTSLLFALDAAAIAAEPSGWILIWCTLRSSFSLALQNEGTLKVADEISWRNKESGKAVTLEYADLKGASFYDTGRSCQLWVADKSGGLVKFDGLRLSDFEKLSAALTPRGVTTAKRATAATGVNFGSMRVNGGGVAIGVCVCWHGDGWGADSIRYGQLRVLTIVHAAAAVTLIAST